MCVCVWGDFSLSSHIHSKQKIKVKACQETTACDLCRDTTNKFRTKDA